VLFVVGVVGERHPTVLAMSSHRRMRPSETPAYGP
jgi:hypothetical protein